MMSCSAANSVCVCVACMIMRGLLMFNNMEHASARSQELLVVSTTGLACVIGLLAGCCFQEQYWKKISWHVALTLHCMYFLVSIRFGIRLYFQSEKMVETFFPGLHLLPFTALCTLLLRHTLLCIYTTEGSARSRHILGGILCAGSSHSFHMWQFCPVTSESRHRLELPSSRGLASAHESESGVLHDIVLPAFISIGSLTVIVGVCEGVRRYLRNAQTPVEDVAATMHNVTIGQPAATPGSTQRTASTADRQTVQEEAPGDSEDARMSRVAVTVKCGLTEIPILHLDYRTVRQFSGAQLKHCVLTRIERTPAHWELLFDESPIAKDWLVESFLRERSWPLEVYVIRR